MYAPVTNDIKEAVRIITQGRIVAFPTGTSYGLAVDALQGYALQRLRNLKKRPREKTFTVFLRSDLISRFFEVSPEEEAFLEKHENTALTLLLTPREALQHIAHEGTVGLRVIDHPVMQALADQVDVPLTATSANTSGEAACYTAECIHEAFPGKVTLDGGEQEKTGNTTYDLSLGCILDGGNLQEGRVSTIVRLDTEKVTVVRPGSVSLS